MLLKFVAKCNTSTNEPMPGVSAHLMKNIQECYEKVLEQSTSITDLQMEGQCLDWKDFDMNKFAAILKYTKSVLSTTNATKDIGNINIC
ncbi:MAG: hypothetical protein ACKPKO_04310 [Candidatus Fonsibacter sp.]